MASGDGTWLCSKTPVGRLWLSMVENDLENGVLQGYSHGGSYIAIFGFLGFGIASTLHIILLTVCFFGGWYCPYSLYHIAYTFLYHQPLRGSTSTGKVRGSANITSDSAIHHRSLPMWSPGPSGSPPGPPLPSMPLRRAAITRWAVCAKRSSKTQSWHPKSMLDGTIFVSQP